MAQPFCLEPEYDSDDLHEIGSESDSDDSESNEDVSRLETTAWCTCNKCTMEVESVSMCLCCRELTHIKQKTKDDCITCHEDFPAVCLNKAVLWTALVSIHDRENRPLPRPDCVENRSYRYAAYRHFTWWTHGYLGKRIRRVLPSCVVKAIRDTFPSPDGTYTGFKGIQEIALAWEL